MIPSFQINLSRVFELEFFNLVLKNVMIILEVCIVNLPQECSEKQNMIVLYVAETIRFRFYLFCSTFERTMEVIGDHD